MTAPSGNPQGGFSLIEIMVTVAITTIGLVGLMALMLESDRSVQDSSGRAIAVQMVSDITNRIRANTDGLANYHTNGGNVDCSAAPTRRCANYHTGSSGVDAQQCTATEMATFDLWDVACPSGANDIDADVTRSGSADYLANPLLRVDVDQDIGSAGTNLDNVQITLSWDARTGGTNNQGQSVYNNDEDIVERRLTIVSEFNIISD